MTKYIGLGQDCIVTEILNRGGLRDCSFPFDYIFAFPCDIKASLDKDFSDWLDPKYLVAGTRHDGHSYTIHELYDSHTKAMRDNNPYISYGFFNHHDVVNDPGRGVFQRRIARYRDVIGSKEDVVLVTTSTPESFKEVGLDTYYNDRTYKTTIVYLKKLGSRKDAAKLSFIHGNWILEYYATSEHNDKISRLICRILKNSF